MRFFTSTVAAAMVAFAQAQTPEGFQPQVTTKLEVLYNSTSVTAGQQLTIATTSRQPQLAISGMALNPSDTFVFMMVDLDVQLGGGNSGRSALLHALVRDFKATQQSVKGNGTLLSSTATGPASYFGPMPPATDSTPHRYVELLFVQPTAFSVQDAQFTNTQSRVNFNLATFMTQNSLQTPIAANFFRVGGRQNSTLRGTATGSGGIVRNTLEPFEGAVGKVEMSRGLAGLLGGLALFAI